MIDYIYCYCSVHYNLFSKNEKNFGIEIHDTKINEKRNAIWIAEQSADKLNGKENEKERRHNAQR